MSGLIPGTEDLKEETDLSIMVSREVSTPSHVFPPAWTLSGPPTMMNFKTWIIKKNLISDLIIAIKIDSN